MQIIRLTKIKKSFDEIIKYGDERTKNVYESNFYDDKCHYEMVI